MLSAVDQPATSSTCMLCSEEEENPDVTLSVDLARASGDRFPAKILPVLVSTEGIPRGKPEEEHTEDPRTIGLLGGHGAPNEKKKAKRKAGHL